MLTMDAFETCARPVPLLVAMRMLVLAVGIASSTGAQALTVAPWSTAEIGARSDVIVTGTVTAAHPQWSHGRIVTLYDISVLTTRKGQAAVVQHVLVPGGSANGVTQRAVGMPELVMGGGYLLCLSGPAPFSSAGVDAVRGIVGWSSGAWRLDAGAARALAHDRGAGIVVPVEAVFAALLGAPGQR